MEPLRGAVLLALLCIVVYMPTPSQSQLCEAPNWVDSVGPNPFTERQGKVVLVALLKGYCRYCIRQAARLQQLKTRLIAEGYTDIDMLIVNGGEARSRYQVSNLINASPIPVIQDSESHTLYRQVFPGSKDDFLVYDRCNQAAVFIPHPYSDLTYTFTEQVLKYVHDGSHDCYCSRDYSPVNTDDVMMGDDPGAASYRTQNMNIGPLQCNEDDIVCQQFRNVLSENNFPTSRRRSYNGAWGSALGTGRSLFRRRHRGMGGRRGNSDPNNIGYVAEGGYGGGAGMGSYQNRRSGDLRRRFGAQRMFGGFRRRSNSHRRNNNANLPAGSSSITA